jgi:hypothetical protein
MVWHAWFGNRVAAFRLCLVTPGRRRNGIDWRTHDIYCGPLPTSVICSRRRSGNELWALLNWDAYRWDCRRPLWRPSFAACCTRDDPHIGSGQWLNKPHRQAFWFCWLRFCSPPARQTKRSPVRRPRNLLQLSPEKKCLTTDVTLRARWDPATCAGECCYEKALRDPPVMIARFVKCSSASWTPAPWFFCAM